jgi:hypothetical protein
VAGHDGEGNTVSLNPAGMKTPNRALRLAFQIVFEQWEKRLDPYCYLSERMRILELELEGRFKFLDLPIDIAELSGTLQ